MELIERPLYLNRLIALRDKQLIKIISGIRRCGKSTLFDLYIAYLLQQGVQREQIIRINLEDPQYHDLQNYLQLYNFIKAKLTNSEYSYYVFLDEVQNVSEFQKAVDGLFIMPNCDVYVTGSNAYLLSGELATLLSGRYIEIKMLPLSFREYMSAMPEQTDLGAKFNKYLQNGGFPYALQLDKEEDILAYLDGIYNTIVLKDVISRKNIGEVALLDRLVRYMFDIVGNICSARKIAGALVSAGHKVSSNTIENYLDALTKSFILYKAGRYNLKGKKLLQSGSKYYLADLGLRRYLLGSRQTDMGHLLENVVYFELLRRGYEVTVGQIGDAEVDFVAVNSQGEEYYQVALSVLDENTLRRELSSLEAIQDHNPKYLLTMDYLPINSFNGIKQINVIEWLLAK